MLKTSKDPRDQGFNFFAICTLSTPRSSHAEPQRIKGLQINSCWHSINNKLCQGSSSCRCIENAPAAMSCGNIRPIHIGDFPNYWYSIFRTGQETRLCNLNLSICQDTRNWACHSLQHCCCLRPWYNLLRIVRNSHFFCHATHIDFTSGSWVNFWVQHLPLLCPITKKTTENMHHTAAPIMNLQKLLYD